MMGQCSAKFVYDGANVGDTGWHGISSWLTDTVAGAAWCSGVRDPLFADLYCREPACAELLVDLCYQLLLRMDVDRLGDCAGVGVAGPAEVRVRVEVARVLQSLVEVL